MNKAGFREAARRRSRSHRSSHGLFKRLTAGVLFCLVSVAPALGQHQASVEAQSFVVTPLPEVRHAREAARTTYHERARQLNLGPLNAQEQDHILELNSITTASYISIPRDIQLRPSNWALVKQEDGFDVWQAHIHSPSAVSLWLYFSDFHLDPGMAVNLYEPAGDDAIREYTGRGLARGNDGFVAFPTLGNTVVVEFWVPATYQLEPGGFPFAVGKVNHTFRDGDGVVHGVEIQKATQSETCEPANLYGFNNNFVDGDSPEYVHDVSQGVLSICRIYHAVLLECGSGSLLNNKSGDGALYALMVSHLIHNVIDIGAEDKPYIDIFFNAPGNSIAHGARFVAGRPQEDGDGGGDWSIVRLEGGFSGAAGYKLLGWKSHTPNTFDGYSVHHAGSQFQQWGEFLAAQLGHKDANPGVLSITLYVGAGDGGGGGRTASAPFCEGAACGMMYAWFRGLTPTYGSSGAPAFYEETGSIVGLFNTSTEGTCEVGFYGMGGIYSDERAFNVLNYGDAYYNNSDFPKMNPATACATGSSPMAGSGTENDPYQAENICHLRGIDESPESHYIQTKDMDAATVTHGWKNGFLPIQDFSGTFDGNGYQISNLTVGVAEGAIPRNVGLFGKLEGGLLKRVKLVNFLTKEGWNAGALVGLNDRGTIEDSEVDGEVNGGGYIGGLVGVNQGGVIRNSTVTVSVKGKTRQGGAFFVGGLVGQNQGGTIENSRSLGTVTGGSRIGGLAGENAGSIRNSHARGKVTGTATEGYGLVGGLVGLHSSGTISDSSATGKVVGAGSQVGGLVGLSESGATISDSYATGEVVGAGSQVGGLVGLSESGATISSSRARGKVHGDSQVGGLVGLHSNGTISGSFATGVVVGAGSQVGGLVGLNESDATISDSYSGAPVTGGNLVGGLAGKNSGSITASHAKGKVSGDSQVGGLAGKNSGSITASYTKGKVSGDSQVGGLAGKNSGSITASHAKGKVSGDSQVGGLVGLNESGATISDSYSKAPVTGGNLVGGLAGENSGSITASQATGKVAGTGSQIGGLVGLNESDGTIMGSYSEGNVRGSGKVGGLAGENAGLIGESYVGGSVGGTAAHVGGIAGLNGKDASIRDSYARGAVNGGSLAGGLAGENMGSISDSYSIGHVTRTDLAGLLVGLNGGTIARSYAGRIGDETASSLVGRNDNEILESFWRTVEQMKCPIASGTLCLETTTYRGWNAQIWHFGSSRTLPLLRAITDISEAPVEVRADWKTGDRLELEWMNGGTEVDFYELEIAGIIRTTREAHFNFDSPAMAELRGRYASGSRIDYFIRGSRGSIVGDSATGSFYLMKIPGEPGVRTASGLTTVQVTIAAPSDDGYGRVPGNDVYGKPAGGIALDLGYRVQLFSRGLLVQERHLVQRGWASSTVVEFSDLAGGYLHKVKVLAYNQAGSGTEVVSQIFTFVAACPKAAVVTATGSGSEHDPWQVTTLCQLHEMRYDTAAHYQLANDIEASPTHRWEKGKGFPPIDDFSGLLDGDGHSILNLLIKPGNIDNVGLFGYLIGGTLQRLALVNAMVQGKNKVGALVGSNKGLLTRNHVAGTVTGHRQVGGMVGENHAIVQHGRAETSVTGFAFTDVHQTRVGSSDIGGLVGRNQIGAVIRNSSAVGTVTGDFYVGGLVGLNYGGAVHHSRAKSTVTGNINGLSGGEFDSFVGGLVGHNVGNITGAYSEGTVKGNSEVGGLAGHNLAFIVDSHSDSTVTGDGDNVGGLVGKNQGPIIRSHAAGSVSGNERVGGLAGYNNSDIIESYATGSVSGNAQVGGLVGNDVRRYSRIHNSYVAGLVVGNEQVGTLVGHYEGDDAVSNYAAKAPDGSSVVALVGSGGGTTEGNFSRTLAQLRCPLAPGEACQGASTYSGWSTRTWYFGNEQTLPVHRALRPLPPAAPLQLQAKWNSEAELELRWTAVETGSLNAGYWLKMAGRSLEVESTFFTLGGNLLRTLRTQYESSDSFLITVRGYNRYGLSEATTIAVNLLGAPGKLADVRAMAQVFSLRVFAAAPADDGHGHLPESSAYGFTSTGVSLNLGYRMRLYAGGELLEERELGHEDGELSATLEFSGLASDARYEIVAVAYNGAGEGLPVSLSVFTRPSQCEGKALASATGSGLGSGNENDPWRIATLCQLQDIRSAPAAHYRLADDIEAGPSRNWRDGKGFAPIDDFSGSLDGAGYQIFHLTVNSEAENVGMFARLSGGLLRQVVLVNAQVQGGTNVGALAGLNEGGEIIKSGATGSVLGRQIAGGLVGVNAGVVRDSAAQVAVGPGVRIAGGLVGQNQAGGVIATSHAWGSVSAEVLAGGLLGDNQSSVTDSYASASVSGGDLAGGLVGNNQGFVARSYATGQVSGNGRSGRLVGSSLSTIVDSYAARSDNADGGNIAFIGDAAGFASGSFLRTLEQLRCPIAPESECAGATTYSGWSAATWFFGNHDTLPVLHGFNTPVGRPLRLRAEWKSPSALLLRWQRPLNTEGLLGYRLETGKLAEETLSDYFMMGPDDGLQELRARHEGGEILTFRVRGYNLYGSGAAGSVSVRLLDVPAPLAGIQVVPGISTLRLSFAAPANDGYGRVPGNHDYGTALGRVALNLGYRIRLYAAEELVQEQELVLDDPRQPVTVEFTDLASASEYRLEAFAHNTVGSGLPVRLRTVTRFSECLGKGLKSATGTGSSSTPYQIATLCQLQDVRAELQAHYVLTADIDAGASREWLGGAGFRPIENFSGTFSGAGQQISNLHIDRSKMDAVGLFARLTESGVIRQLVLSEAQVTGKNSVGALVGFNAGTVMDSVVTSAQVTGSVSIGGLVGGNSGLLVNSGASADIHGLKDVGGLAGYVKEGGRVVGSTTRATQVRGALDVGGLVGNVWRGTILYSSAETSVRGTEARGNVGGLVGKARHSTIYYSYAAGSVSGGGVDVGGLVGFSASTIAYSYADAAVSGDQRVGGLVGRNEGDIRAAYALGSVLGNGNVGGLVGSNMLRIRDSYAFNPVTGEVDSSGMLVGYNGRGAGIDNSYAAESLKSSKTLTLVGNDSGVRPDSSLRTLAQLRCPVVAGQSCAGAVTYSGWQPQTWHFGNARTLPLLRELAEIPATPIELTVTWKSLDHLQFKWLPGSTPVDYYELEIPGTLRKVTTPDFDFKGDLLAEFRKNHNEGCPHHYQLRAMRAEVAGYAAEGYFYLPGVPGTATITELVPGTTTARLVLSTMGSDNCVPAGVHLFGHSPVVTPALAPDFGYVVVVSAAGRSTETFFPVSAVVAEIEISGLLPLRNYGLEVYARNQAGSGQSAERHERSSAFRTIEVPDRPSDLQARWKSANRLVLNWAAATSNGATIDTYQLSFDGESYRTSGANTSYVLSDHELERLRETHTGGAKILYAVRAVNRAGTGAASTEAFTLLNVPGPLDVVQIAPGMTTLKIRARAPANDGYGRVANHEDYGAPVDEIPLNLSFQIQLLSNREVVQEQEIALVAPVLQMEFLGLPGDAKYEVAAFARNAAGTGRGTMIRHSISSAPDQQKLRLKVFLGGLAH